MMSHLFHPTEQHIMIRNPLSALRRTGAAALLGLAVMPPAHAGPGPDLPPGVIQPVWYASTVDMAAGTATFSVRFDRAPDLLTVDEVFRQADAFQYWTDTVSADPIGSTYDGIFGTGPLGTQSVIATGAIPLNGQLTYIWPTLLSDPAPRDPGGWGTVQAYGGYRLAGDTVSFDVSLVLLHAQADGRFNYAFETYQFGAGGTVDYLGVSGQAYEVPAVPEPSPSAMLGVGMLLLGVRAAARRHGRRPGG
jgi:hypothetical protein